ncbi:MAG: hypothetical protein L0Y72_29175, partial [Gemmataceae bacterium]|nr:hypothetical protein [Gemmataceae bacterium]
MIQALAVGLALAVCLWARPGITGQETLQQSLVVAGNSKPIQLFADNIATWEEAGQRVFVLQGKVVIEQGVTIIRAAQAALWLDEQAKKTSGFYKLRVYAEDVVLDEGAQKKDAPVADLKLATRGEIRVKSYASQVEQRVLRGHAVYRRARDSFTPGASNVGGAASLAQSTSKSQAAKPAASPTPAPPVFPTASQTTKKDDQPIVQAQAIALPPLGPNVAPAPPGKVVPPAEQPTLGPISPLQGPLGDGTPRKVTIRPRSSEDIKAGNNFPQGDETAIVVTTGVILTVTDPTNNKVLLDIEADRLVTWTKGDNQQLFGSLRGSEGVTTKKMEFYLSGNVEIRNQMKTQTEIIRADEVYYDVGRNVAIALRADLEIREPRLPYPIHFKAEELHQLNAKMFTGTQTQVFSTILPSDPGLKIEVRDATIEERTVVRTSIFGREFIDPKTGKPQELKEHIFTGNSNVVRFEGVPIFWAPYVKTKVEDPLGPLDNVSINHNSIFGLQLFTTWDVHELLGVVPDPGSRWRLFLDGMTERGPALGTQYLFKTNDLIFPGRYEGQVKAYGLHDSGVDILGGGRGQVITVAPGVTLPMSHPEWRGRFLGQLNVQELPAGFSVLGQVSALSDQNFLEQFYQHEFQNGLNQETFIQLKQQNGIWAWTLLAEPNIRNWVTETEWLPKADGYVLGLSLFDILTYNLHASAGYGRLRPTEDPAFAFSPTDARTDTGRFDLWQELSLPFSAGPFRVVPFVVGALTYYTND